MNKLKVFTIIMIAVTVFCTLYQVVYAGFGDGFDASQITYDKNGQDKTSVTKVTTPVVKIFNTIVRIMQILSVAGIIFTGLRYMFTTDTLKKADLKESTMYMLIGMVIVFSASTVIGFITQAADEVIKINQNQEEG